MKYKQRQYKTGNYKNCVEQCCLA